VPAENGFFSLIYLTDKLIRHIYLFFSNFRKKSKETSKTEHEFSQIRIDETEPPPYNEGV